jgi:hypothetical protein
METENLILTDEMKKKLKGVLGFQVDAKFSYVPKIYREKSKITGDYDIPKTLWPVFTLRGLNGVEATLAEDELDGRIVWGADDTRTVEVKRARIKINTCKRGIVTWKNFRDCTGKLIAVPTAADPNDTMAGIKEECLRYVSPELMTELTNAITEQSYLTEEELRGLE